MQGAHPLLPLGKRAGPNQPRGKNGAKRQPSEKAQWKQGGERTAVSEIPLHPKSRVGKHLQKILQPTSPVEVTHGYFDRISHRIFDGLLNASPLTRHSSSP